jgi:hypothetical protein
MSRARKHEMLSPEPDGERDSAPAAKIHFKVGSEDYVSRGLLLRPTDARGQAATRIGNYTAFARLVRRTVRVVSAGWSVCLGRFQFRGRMESPLHCDVFLALVSSYGETKWTSRHDSIHNGGSATVSVTSTFSEAHDGAIFPAHERYREIGGQSSCESTTCRALTGSASDAISRKISSSGDFSISENVHTAHVSSHCVSATRSSNADESSNVRPASRLDGGLDRLTGDSVPTKSIILDLPNPAVHAKPSMMEPRIDTERCTSSRFSLVIYQDQERHIRGPALMEREKAW